MKRYLVALAVLAAVAVGIVNLHAQAGPRSVELRVFQVTADPSTCLPNRFYIQNTSHHLFFGQTDSTCVDAGLLNGSVSKSPSGSQTITGGSALINTGGFTGPLMGSQQDVQSAFATDGAVNIKFGTALLTKSASAGAYTLANPTAGTDDGKILYLVSTTAKAHVVTTGSSGVNATNNTLTFGGAIGDGVVLEAYNGSWYIRSTTNVTASTV